MASSRRRRIPGGVGSSSPRAGSRGRRPARSPPVANGARVELELELSLLGELRRRPHLRARLVVVDDAQAPVGASRPRGRSGRGSGRSPRSRDGVGLPPASPKEASSSAGRSSVSPSALPLQQALDLGPHPRQRIRDRGRWGTSPCFRPLPRAASPRASPASDVAGARDPVVPGGVPVEALEHPVDDRAGGQSLGLGIEALRGELVVDEPAVRAFDPLLERSGADGVALGRSAASTTDPAAAPGALALPRPERGKRAASARAPGRRQARRRRAPAHGRASACPPPPPGSGASRSRTSSTKGSAPPGAPPRRSSAIKARGARWAGQAQAWNR